MTFEAMLEQAVARHRSGDLAAAEALYLKLLAAAPHSFTPRHLLGVLRGQQGRLAEAIALIGGALAARPDVADAQYNYGKVLKDAGRLSEALTAFDRAHRLGNPGARGQRAEVQNRMSVALQQKGDFPQALALADRAIADAPGYGNAHENRGVALSRLGRTTESLASLERALALQSDYAQVHFNYANALRETLRFEEAMASFDRAIALDPDFVDAWRNKGLLALLQGDFAAGLPLYEWRKKASPPVEARIYPQPLWTGAEDISGKTVLTYVEQGLGDTIQFYRFVAPLLERGARVVLSAPQCLLALLGQGRWPVALIGNRDTPPAFDFHIPLMSIPLALGLARDSIPAGIPYLSAEPDRVARWKARIGEKGFKIGISWQGAVSQVAGRAMPLAAFAPLASLPGVRLISLQKGAGTEQLAALPAVERLGADFDSGPDAFLDTAAVMANLDLVITLDSGPAHLAGALARPAWVALKQVPDWRWFLARDDSPWYPGMRLFRQTQSGDWTSVFTAMRARLEEML
jgi:tetratricopeptide (TPR) repeat protein